MDRNALAELLQALESRRDAEERRREERYTALIERSLPELWEETAPHLIHHPPCLPPTVPVQPVSQLSERESPGAIRSAPRKCKRRAEALELRERKSQNKDNKIETIVLAGKTLGRPHK
ncbi:UNVERIFIED_CONTAM: hypothetical protein FKN15_077820 [Acipenser sinensis]